MAKKLAVVLVLAGVVFVWLARSRPGAPARHVTAPPAATEAPPAHASEPEGAHREAPATWRGRVVDDTGAGIAGIDVTVDGPLDTAEEQRTPLTARSGADGGFEFPAPTDGRYALVAEPAPGATQDRDAPWLGTSLPEVASDAPVLVTLARGAVIRGRTLGGAQQPLAGYVVIGIGANGETTWASTTDAEGRFELVVPVGTSWDVQVSLPPSGAKSAGENTQYTERKVRAGTKDLVLQFVPMLPRGG